MENNRIEKEKTKVYEYNMIDTDGLPRIGQSFWCPYCGNTASYPIPVEPMYFLDEVYKLIPFPTAKAARVWLLRHRDEYEPTYVRVMAAPGHGKAGGSRLKRVLSASEIRRLRNERVIRDYG